ncbi:MAG: PAS domain S-box protein [Gemmatimonadota bacterium]
MSHAFGTGSTAMVDALHRSALFDAESQESVQRTLRVAAASLNAPLAMLSIGDGARQVLRGHARVREPGIPSQFEAYGDLMRVHHGRATFLRDAAVTMAEGAERSLVACTFAAAPLVVADGSVIGMLAVADRDGREDGDAIAPVLREMAAGLVEQLRLRAENVGLQQKQANLELQKQVFGLIAEGAPLEVILSALASFIEHQSEGTLCVIRLLRPDGRLCVEAAPTMPESLLVLMDTVLPSASGCPAARASFTGEPVVGPATAASGMLEQGIRSVWSFPVRSNDTPFGTIDLFRMHEGEPEDEHLHLVSVATSAARIAIDRRRAEAELRSSEIYHRALIENTSEFILVLDANGSTRYVSRRFAHAVGREPDGVRSMAEVVVPEDLPVLDSLLGELLQSEEREFELRIVSHDGTVRHILGTGTNLLENTAVQGLVINARDITQQKLAVAAVSDSEERYRLVARASSDLIWDWDVGTGGRVWPAGDEKRFGYEYADLPAHHEAWCALVHPEDADRVTSGLEILMKDPDAPTWSDEYRLRQKDGTYATVLDRGFIVRGEDGAALRVIGSMMDLTTRRMLEEQLRQAQRMEAIGRLAGGVAHDFNNLLTVIEGFTAILMEEIGAEGDQGMALLEIQKASTRAAALTRQLLAFSRRQVLQPRLLDMNQVVRGVGGMLRRLIPADVRLETHLGAGEMLVHADDGQVEQVLLNLVINARESIEQGGTVTVRTNAVALSSADMEMRHRSLDPGEYIRLSVSDDGCGMDADVVRHVFEPFFTTKESGTGLGLATVYGIVEQSGGHVEVHSAPGVGSCFDVYLPRCQSAAGVASVPDAIPGAVPPSGHETILIVEDDPAVRDLTRRLLTRQGYEVFVADDGPAALRVILNGDVIPDLLLTDVVLPQMSGPVVARRILSLRPDTALVFMSGYTDEQLGQHGVLAEDVAFLQKPFQAGRLLTLIRERLDARAAGKPADSPPPRLQQVAASCR